MHVLDGGERAELVDSDRPFAWLRSDLVVDVGFVR